MLLTGLYRREVHVWYELDIGGEGPQPRPPKGVRLLQAGESDLPLLEQLPSISSGEAERRYEAGASLWLALDGRCPAFACWIFFDEMPLYASRQGSLRLPAHTVGLEDSVTSPAHRGQGIAPWAWSQIATSLAETGVTTIVTKVSIDNVASRRAVEKSGFHEAARMRLVEVGPWRRVEFYTEPAGANPSWLHV